MAKTNTDSGLPKGEIKFTISLNTEQKEGKRLILENEITIITGNPGTGKSALTAQSCLDLIFKYGYRKVYLVRPTIEVGKSLGFLPGSLSEKYDPYIEAFVENLKIVYPHHDKLDKMIEQEVFSMCPIQFIRGKTIRDKELLIIEESQNTTKEEIEALFTRLGKGGKIICNGDLRQKDGKFDGLDFALELFRNVEGIKHIDLKANHRSGLVGDILNYIYR